MTKLPNDDRKVIVDAAQIEYQFVHFTDTFKARDGYMSRFRNEQINQYLLCLHARSKGIIPKDIKPQRYEPVDNVIHEFKNEYLWNNPNGAFTKYYSDFIQHDRKLVLPLHLDDQEFCHYKGVSL